MSPSRRMMSWVMIAGMLTSGMFVSVSCSDSALMDRFRSAASDSLEEGAKSLADGVIEGLFALFMPESSSASSASGT